MAYNACNDCGNDHSECECRESSHVIRPIRVEDQLAEIIGGPIDQPTAVILRGPSGAGKTTLQERFAICSDAISADDYFETERGYHYEPHKLDEAHAQCFRDFLTWCQDVTGEGSTGVDKVMFVDNTNTLVWHLSPYVQASLAYGVRPVLLMVERDVSLKTLAIQNRHGVKLATITRQIVEANVRLPFAYRKFERIYCGTTKTTKPAEAM